VFVAFKVSKENLQLVVISKIKGHKHFALRHICHITILSKFFIEFLFQTLTISRVAVH